MPLGKGKGKGRGKGAGAKQPSGIPSLNEQWKILKKSKRSGKAGKPFAAPDNADNQAGDTPPPSIFGQTPQVREFYREQEAQRARESANRAQGGGESRFQISDISKAKLTEEQERRLMLQTLLRIADKLDEVFG